MKTAYAVAFSDGRFLMVRNPKRNGWEMPGGHIENDETPEQAVVREFHEESGFDIRIVGRMDLGTVAVFAAVLGGHVDESHEMIWDLFDEIPDELAFPRDEYETVIPWARDIIERQDIDPSETP